MGRDARLLADEHAVGVDEPPARRPHLRVGLGQQRERRDAAEALVARGEERADVAEPGRAEQRVDQRVREDVAVGVAGEAARMVELDPAEHERDARPRARARRRRSRSVARPPRRLALPLDGEPGLDALEVGRRRHLEQPLVAGDDLHPAAGRLDERRAVGALARGAAARRTSRRTPAASGRRPARRAASVSTTTPSRARLTVSATGRPGTAPSKPSPSASSRRGTSSGGSERPRRVVDEDRPPRPPAPRRARRAPRPSASSPPGTHARDLRRAELLGEQDRRLLPAGRRDDDDRRRSTRTRRAAAAARRAAGSPPSRANAFGRSSPSRSPRPAATSTAQTPSCPPR